MHIMTSVFVDLFTSSCGALKNVFFFLRFHASAEGKLGAYRILYLESKVTATHEKQTSRIMGG